jgi:hypothetical protein
MTTPRPSAAAPILVAILILATVTSAAYVGSYFTLMTGWRTITINDEIWTVRIYDHRWQQTMFTPAAWAEGKLRGVDVRTKLSTSPAPR